MARLHRYVIWPVVLLASMAAFMGGGHLLFDHLIDRLNARQVDELGGAIVRRAELAVDYAFISLGDLAEKGTAGCGPASLEEVRRQVYTRGSIKDIRVVDPAGQVICAAFPQTQEFDAAGLSRDTMVTASVSHIKLFPLPQRTGVSLGVLWDLTNDLSLVAIVNVDALLFEMLPSALREGSELSLTLRNGHVVSRYAAEDSADTQSPRLNFAATSERYPISAAIRVDAATFAAWNRESEPFALAVAGALGALFGALLCKIIRRPRDALADLDEALEQKVFKSYMQPIFSLATGEIVGCEVLARWIRADGSLVSPLRFIPLAEEHGRIAPLTRQIVSDALQHLRPWLQQNKTFKVGINISPNHLLEDGFISELKALVAAARVSPRQILLEVTEREEIQDLARAAATIARLRDGAFKVAIDDVGTGHSGLSYVQKLGPDTIKIDKFFVDSITEDPTARAVVEMLVRLARELGMTTVAEGIERADQVAMLKACGVDEGQGFVVSPPLNPVAFLDLLRRHGAPAPNVERMLAGAA